MQVTVFSTSPNKREDALKLGAKHFVVSKNPEEMKSIAKSLHLILNTVSADINVASYLATLVNTGVFVVLGMKKRMILICVMWSNYFCIGVSPVSIPIPPFSIIKGNKVVAGIYPLLFSSSLLLLSSPSSLFSHRSFLRSIGSPFS